MPSKLPVRRWEAVLYLLGIVLLVHPSGADAQSLSAIPAAFLEDGPSPATAALGQAGVASSAGIESVWANPAAATSVGRVQFLFAYLDQFELIEHGQAAVGFSSGNWGLGLHVRDSGDDALRESVVRLSLARRFGRLSMGANAGLLLARFGRNTLNPDALAVFDPAEIAQGMANQIRGDASGITGGFGVRYALGRAALAASVSNAVSYVQWESAAASGAFAASYRQSLPTALWVGAQVPAGRQGLVLLDYAPALDSEIDDRLRAGLEWTLAGILALRAGTERSLNGQPDEGVTFGFGLHLPPVAGVRVGADYAYVDSYLGASQHVAVRVGF
ncbi:MAG: hypothetical protein HKN29_04010 [Rhodothermales bacterium]|nr:hypothetical protein [Rhodothermales bacterium]